VSDDVRDRGTGFGLGLGLGLGLGMSRAAPDITSVTEVLSLTSSSGIVT